MSDPEASAEAGSPFGGAVCLPARPVQLCDGESRESQVGALDPKIWELT